MEGGSAQTLDVLKLVGLILGGYGALLSTYNFLVAHYGRLIVEYGSEDSEDFLGRVRVLCIGRPRFVDDVVIKDKNGRVIKSVDVEATLSRGESRRIKLERRSFQSGQELEVVVASERRKIARRFTV